MTVQLAQAGNASRRMSPAQGFDALVSQIAARHDALPRQLRSIARLALDAPEDFALGTAAELAAAAGVQPSALVRFAHAFGFEGFASLRQVFRSHLVARAPTYRERIETLKRASATPLTPGSVLRSQVDDAIHGLQQFHGAVEDRTLSSAIDHLLRARQIALLAARRSFPVVGYLTYALAQLERRVALLDGVGGMNAQLAAALGPGDVLMVVSFRNYTPEVVDIARDVRRRGAQVIAMTDSRTSPLVPHATVALLVGDDRRTPFRSLVEPIVLAQSLVIALGHRLTDAPARRRQRRSSVRGGRA